MKQHHNYVSIVKSISLVFLELTNESQNRKSGVIIPESLDLGYIQSAANVNLEYIGSYIASYLIV